MRFSNPSYVGFVAVKLYGKKTNVVFKAVYQSVPLWYMSLGDWTLVASPQMPSVQSVPLFV